MSKIIGVFSSYVRRIRVPKLWLIENLKSKVAKMKEMNKVNRGKSFIKKTSISLLIIVLVILQSFGPVKAARSKSVNLNFVSGIQPDLDLVMHSKDTDLDFTKDSLYLRLKIKTKSLYDVYGRFDAVKLVAYEYINGEKYEISSTNATLGKNKLLRVDVELNRFETNYREIFFDLYSPSGQLINTYSYNISANNIASQGEASGPDLLESDCDNTVFGSCQLKYFFENVSFEANPSSSLATRIIKDENGKYRVKLPVLAQKSSLSIKKVNLIGSGGSVSIEDQVGSIAFGSGLNSPYVLGYDQATNSLALEYGSDRLISVTNSGALGLGVENPSAILHLAASKNNLAPIRFSSGPFVDPLVEGALEFDGTRLFLTVDGTRKGLAFAGEGGTSTPVVVSGGGGSAPFTGPVLDAWLSANVTKNTSSQTLTNKTLENPNITGVTDATDGYYLRLKDSLTGELEWATAAGAGDMLTLTYDNGTLDAAKQVAFQDLAQTLTNKTYEAAVFNGSVTHNNGDIVFNDNEGDFNFTVKANGRPDFILANGADATITLNGDLTVFNIADNAASGKYLKLLDAAAGTLAWDTPPVGGGGGDVTLVGVETLTNKTLTSPIILGANTKIDGLADEAVNRVLQMTNTDGSVRWVDLPAAGPGGGDLEDEATPKLGGELDLNGHGITDSVGDIHLNGAVIQTDGNFFINNEKASLGLLVHGLNKENLFTVYKDGVGILNAPDSFTETLAVNGSAMFNNKGRDYDFVIQGDNEPNLFFVDAGTNRVGIGNNNPSQTLDITGTFNLSSNATLGGTLGVAGATSLLTLNTSGAATLHSLGVTNNASVGGTLAVTGASTLAAVNTSGLINAAGGLTVSAGSTNLLATNIDGISTFNGDVVFNDHQNSKNFTIKGDTVDELFKVDGAADSITTNGDITLMGDSLTLNGETLKILNSAYGLGKVLTSDASGVATWENLPVLSTETAPTLGGDLETDTHNIVASDGTINLADNTLVEGSLEINGITTFNGAVLFDPFITQDGSDLTVDWTKGNKQKITLTGSDAVTFTDPAGSGVASLTLFVVQGAGGNHTITSWNSVGSVKWPGGVPVTLSEAENEIDIVVCIFDGADYYCQAALDFQ